MTTTATALAQDIGLARETDYFLMKDQLTDDELGLLYKVRKFAETEVLPVVNSSWCPSSPGCTSSGTPWRGTTPR